MIRRYFLTAALLAFSVTFLSGQDLFPGLSKYKMRSDYPVYTPDDLWDYINGAADGYLALGFIDLNIREYTRGRSIIKAEIYRFGDDARAFGIYSMERSPAVLSLIELLARSTRHQLHRMRDDVPVAAIHHKQVDMV